MTETNEHMGNNDVAPSFAISLAEATERIDLLKEFVRDHMTEGEDFGVIPGTSSKPTLLKPGAEKLNAMFGLAPVAEVANRVEDWDKGFIAYEVKVTLLNKRTQNIEAEGLGNCNSKERKYKNQDAANVANTILKMAKKRALIDATLSATRASGVFTQDLEDLSHEPETPRQNAPQRPQNAPQQVQQAPNGAAPACKKCGGAMWDNRASKASGKISAKSPDFKCKDKENCDYVIWPPRNGDAPPQQQEQPPREATPEHVVRLKTAMQNSGTPYTKSTSVRWVASIDNYLSETADVPGESPRVERLSDLTPEMAAYVIEAIENALIIFPVSEVLE